MSNEVVWGVKKLELALALDVTGSMDSDDKMTELKKAAKSSADDIEGCREEGRRHQGRHRSVRGRRQCRRGQRRRRPRWTQFERLECAAAGGPHAGLARDPEQPEDLGPATPAIDCCVTRTADQRFRSRQWTRPRNRR